MAKKFYKVTDTIFPKSEIMNEEDMIEEASDWARKMNEESEDREEYTVNDIESAIEIFEAVNISVDVIKKKQEY